MSEVALFGTDLFGDPIRPPSRGALADDWVFPPFTVLNAREGAWQERKDAWIATGIKSEVGREAVVDNIGERPEQERKRTLGQGLQAVRTPDGKLEYREMPSTSAISIFDPVVCELVYRWYCPPDGMILDPFAGGSVRGIVAAMLGRRYEGIDLRPEQVAANHEQADSILQSDEAGRVQWTCADAADLLEFSVSVNPPSADLVFTCPPYGDLEKYSDDPRDLSAMKHDDFLHAYRRIISASCALLREDRFAAIVVGDFRDKRGMMRNFVSDTIAAFQDGGLSLYNEAILVTQVGSGAVRANGQFTASRKLVKCHQNLLVFVKGDPRKATQAVAGAVQPLAEAA